MFEPPKVERPVPPFATERSVPDHCALLMDAQVEAPKALMAVTNWLVQAAAPPYSATAPLLLVTRSAEVRGAMTRADVEAVSKLA